jgi:tetratricopeptide (TPR) repeat protein
VRVADAQTVQVSKAPELQADSPPEEDDDAFDLAAELRESLEDEEAETTIDDPGASRRGADDGFDSIFKDFKAGVSKTLLEDDHETRFDLGIAYREMELYDDAIDEFTICLGSPSHRLESLHMMGLCALNLDRMSDAVNHFEQALASERLEIQKAAGLHFDLGRAFEGQQSWTRAQEAYQAAREADASIPGIEGRIADLEAKLGSSAETIPVQEAGGEVFESFDDLVAEVEAYHDTGEGADMESFGDVIADAEFVGEELEEAESELVTEPGPAGSAEESEASDVSPETAPASDGDAPKPRKKRISFV